VPDDKPIDSSKAVQSQRLKLVKEQRSPRPAFAWFNSDENPLVEFLFVPMVELGPNVSDFATILFCVCASVQLGFRLQPVVYLISVLTAFLNPYFISPLPDLLFRRGCRVFVNCQSSSNHFIRHHVLFIQGLLPGGICETVGCEHSLSPP